MKPTIRSLSLHVFLLSLTLSAPIASAQNLAKYRNFEMGMSVAAVVKETDTSIGSVKTTHATPALVQTLQWNRKAYFSSIPETDPVRSIRFDFYNDSLFKIVAIYGSREVEGMTTSDLIEGISKLYGSAGKPDESITISSYPGYEDRQKVLARWEDGETAFSLFRSATGGEFGLVGLSKKLDGLATLSIREGERLNALSAPQREMERLKKLADDRRITEEKARSSNVPNFKP